MSGLGGNIKIVAMSRITEILDSRAQEVIKRLGSTFSTRNFIWEFMNAYEEDYVELLLEVLPAKKEERKPKIIHELHKRIGKYLQTNADRFGIEKDDEQAKEPSISPFGKVSATQCWRKL